ARAPMKEANRAMNTEQQKRGIAGAIDRMKRALARLVKVGG
ncbi:hypothetical protein LCGC14_2684240, partial [marine sediment metagenome]